MSCTKHKMLVHTIAMILYKKMRSLFMLWVAAQPYKLESREIILPAIKSSGVKYSLTIRSYCVDHSRLQ